jgi:hypothetical protein
MSIKKTTCWCGDTFEKTSSLQKYCKPKCRNLHQTMERRKRAGTWGEVGAGAYCETCLKPFVKNRRVKRHCSPACRLKAIHGANHDIHLGEILECDVCGEGIIRTTSNTKRCGHKCKPKKSFTKVCTACNLPKKYGEFRDYRDRGGRLLGQCNACQLEKVKERQRRKKCTHQM